LWDKNKILLENLTKLELRWSRKGSNQTAVRFFRRLELRPLLHWNPNVQVETHEEKSPTEILKPATITYTLADGRTGILSAVGVNSKGLLDLLKKVHDDENFIPPPLPDQFPESNIDTGLVQEEAKQKQ